MNATNYDAGREREILAEDLANWRAAGFRSSNYARRWQRRAARLARVLGRPTHEVIRELDADADAILAAN